jgi:hypothetical protein
MRVRSKLPSSRLPVLVVLVLASTVLTGHSAVAAPSSVTTHQTAAGPRITSVTPDGGPSAGGTRVTVGGTGLTGVTAVDFGGAAGSSLSLSSSTSLTVTAPPHAAGLVDIQVTTAQGTSPLTEHDRFRYLPPTLKWAPPQRIDTLHYGYLGEISCPDASTCVAVDTDSAVTYTAGSWSEPVRIAPEVVGNGLVTLSCPTSTFCAAMGFNGQTEPYGAYTAVLRNGKWTTQWFGSSGASSVSCASPASCWAVDGAGLYHWNGAGWTYSDAANSSVAGMNSISCPTTTFCAAVGYGGVVTTFDGTTWQPQTLLGGDISFYSVSCPLATSCVATAYTGQSYHFDGTGWTSQTSESSPTGAVTVSCATSSSCLGVNEDGQAWAYDGSGWSVAPSIPGALKVFSVSCWAPDGCRASGIAKTYSWNGQVWSEPEDADYNQGEVNAVSCPTTAFCAVSDALGAVTYYRDGVWARPQHVTETGEDRFRLISCTSATFCMAMSMFSDARSYDGSSWSPPRRSLIDDTFVNAMTCASPTFCLALDDWDHYSVYDGSSWSAQQGVAGNNGGFVSVSCAAVSACVAVSTSGQAFTYDHGTWSAPVQVSPSRLNAVSCPSVSYCLAVGPDQTAYRLADGSWSAVPMPSTVTWATSVSCSAVDACVVVDDQGGAVAFNGVAWSTRTQLDAPESGPAFVSCAGGLWCAAVTSSGDAILTRK